MSVWGTMGHCYCGTYSTGHFFADFLHSFPCSLFSEIWFSDFCVFVEWNNGPSDRQACAGLKDKNICSFSCILTNLTLLFAPYTYCSFPYKPSKASGDLHTKKLSVGCTSLHVSCQFDVPTFTWHCTLVTGLQFGPGAVLRSSMSWRKPDGGIKLFRTCWAFHVTSGCRPGLCPVLASTLCSPSPRRLLALRSGGNE